VKRPCIQCGELIDSGSHCAAHRWPSSPSRLRGRRWQAIRKAVLQVFAYRCAECGAEGVPLEVHHRDHDQTNNAIPNLTVLCRSCHRQVA
jgi:5-methylcytosine-specific restriction endonuclease McrA